MKSARYGAALLGVIFLIGAARPAAGRPTCAVLTFDAKGGITKEEASLLSDRFAIELDRLEAFTLISRAKMSEVLDLNQFSTSAFASSAQGALEAGKLLAVQYMVYGSIGRIGSLYTVNVYLINVESGATEKTGIIDQAGAIENLLTSGMNRAARALITGEAGPAPEPIPTPRPQPPPQPPPAPPPPQPAPAPPRVGWFQIEIYPPDARLYLNGTSIRPGRIQTDPGEAHEISAESSGFAPFSQTFRLAAGQTIPLSIVLRRLPEQTKKPSKDSPHRPHAH